MTAQGSPPTPSSDFGANEWLVDEMHERWQNDPSSVDPAWNTFFQDYRQTPGVPTGDDGTPTPVRGAPATPTGAPLRTA